MVTNYLWYITAHFAMRLSLNGKAGNITGSRALMSMRQHHKPLKLKRKMAVKFEKEIFNGYRIHAYDTTEIILAVPPGESANIPEKDEEQARDNLYRASSSFIVATDTIIKDWPLHDISLLAINHLQPVLQLEPELVLLGTGQKQQFPQTQLLASFYNQGIGVEIMDSPAACRTFNILAGEGRKVVAAIIMDH